MKSNNVLLSYVISHLSEYPVLGSIPLYVLGPLCLDLSLHLIQSYTLEELAHLLETLSKEVLTSSVYHERYVRAELLRFQSRNRAFQYC